MSQGRPTDSETDKYSGSYVLYGCQSTAFRAAFPKSKAKAEVIHISASKFHGLAKVQLRIAELAEQAREIAQKDFKLDANYVSRRLKEIDELDVLDILKDDLKSFKPLSEWPKAWRISISGIDLMTISNDDEDIDAIVKKVKWPDKTKNLELIGKLTTVQAFNEKTSVTHKIITDDGSNEW